MLINFRVRNYRSLRDQAELSLIVPEWVNSADVVKYVPPGERAKVGTVAGIYGSNASGKTTVLRALWTMRRMIVDSHERWKPSRNIPYDHFFTKSAHGKPIMFDADLLIEGARYQYGFSYNDKRILQEWLYEFPKSRRRLLFERDSSGEVEYRFGRGVRGRMPVIADLTRPNSLFLSAAATNNHPDLTPLVKWFDDRLTRTAPSDRGEHSIRAAAQLRDGMDRARTVELLKFADLGISGLRIAESKIADDLKDRLTKVMELMDPDGSYDEVFFEEVTNRVIFEHSGQDGEEVQLDLSDESDGTQAWLALLLPLMRTLRDGGILLVDELDASLHPSLASEIVRMFHDAETNPKAAQLIFNTHDPSLMGSLLGDTPLRRHEVWLTEKDRSGATHLYPLTDFQPRKAENLERGYLQGRYGGVPFIDRDLAVSALGVEGERPKRGAGKELGERG